MTLQQRKRMATVTIFFVLACSGLIWAEAGWKLGLATLFGWFALSGSLDLSNSD